MFAYGALSVGPFAYAKGALRRESILERRWRNSASKPFGAARTLQRSAPVTFINKVRQLRVPTAERGAPSSFGIFRGIRGCESRRLRLWAGSANRAPATPSLACDMTRALG